MSLIPLATAKQFLQISHSKEDVVLPIMLDSLEDWIQKFCAIKFSATITDIEENITGGDRNLRPLWHPILGVTEILDRDTDNDEVEAGLWRNNPTRIWYIDGSYWGAGDERYQVTYTAGYTAATLPAGLKLIILQLMHRSYNKRGGVMSDSVSGYNEKWEDLLKSDEIKQLRGFSFAQVFS